MADEQQKAALYAQLKKSLENIITTVEDLTIKNLLYEGLIEEDGMLSADDLQVKAVAALLDPDNRKAAREACAGMRKALDLIGKDVYYEALLLDLPTPDKPQ